LAATAFAFFAEWCYESKALYIGAFILYVAAFIESIGNTHKYFGNVISAEKIDKIIHDCRDKAPQLTMHLECYHHGRNNRKDVTHTFNEPLNFFEYID